MPAALRTALFLALALPLVAATAPPAAAQKPRPVGNAQKQPKSMWDDGYFKDAAVGDFVEYVNAAGKVVQRKKVAAVGDRTATVVLSTESGGKMMEFPNAYVFDGPDDPNRAAREAAFDDVSTREETVKVAGKELKCTVKEFKSKFGPNQGQVTRTEWYSKQVPFDGLVKSEHKRLGTMTLSKFQYKKAPKE